MCLGPCLEPAGCFLQAEGPSQVSFWLQSGCFSPAASREAIGTTARKLAVSSEASPLWLCSGGWAVHIAPVLSHFEHSKSAHVMVNCDRMGGLSPLPRPVISDTVGSSGVVLGFRGNRSSPATNCHLFHILCIRYMSEAIQNHQDVPLCLCEQAEQK